jgi:hypothetical protein
LLNRSIVARSKTHGIALCACAMALCFCPGTSARADDRSVSPEQFKQLLEENKQLQQQLRHQQEVIESLAGKVNRLEQHAQTAGSDDQLSSNTSHSPARAVFESTFGKLSISAEGGVGLFNTGSAGFSPHAEFRVDEAKLFIEAPVWNHVYFFSEINFATREQPDVTLELGECYLDFESVSALWNRDHMLNIRLGRMDIPFGEEYQSRDVIDNPLISHSLTDFWGVDEGIELYGKIGPVRYVVAAQNGGISDTRDFNPDKSVAGRLAYDPLRWLHLSVSGMRTGDLDAQQDQLSALWFGSAFIRSLGSPGTTKFHANLVEGDISVWLPHGHVSAFGGYLRYQDNDPAGENHRDLYFYSIEGIHDVVGKLYAGARFSQIFAPNGFPISGNGDMGNYFFNPLALTREMWRLSLGLGYRFNQNLLLKMEYTFEHGREQSGDNRDHEDMFALEAAYKF